MTKKPGPSPQKKVVGSVAAMVMLACLTMVYFTLHPMAPRLDRGPFRELGRRLAQEVLQLQQPGSRIVLITRETSQFQTPAYAAMTEGFEQSMQKAGVKLATTRVLKVDPLRVVSVPPGEYVELFRKLEDRDIIVSLLGPPILDAGQLAAMAGRRPRVLAVCSGALPQQVDLKRLFEAKLLQAAVISRTDGVAGGNEFDRNFKIITASDVAELPAPRVALP